MPKTEAKFLISKLRGGLRSKLFWSCAGLLVFLIVIGANIHLLYVSISSQPECVAHQKSFSELNGTYRAANSSC